MTDSCTKCLHVGCCWRWTRNGDGSGATASFDRYVRMQGRCLGRFARPAVIRVTQEAEKFRSAPSRARNGARNRRQAGIAPSVPIEAVLRDRDGVAPAVIVAD